MHFTKMLALVAPFVAVVAGLPHAGSELKSRGYTYTPADCTPIYAVGSANANVQLAAKVDVLGAIDSLAGALQGVVAGIVAKVDVTVQQSVHDAVLDVQLALQATASATATIKAQTVATVQLTAAEVDAAAQKALAASIAQINGVLAASIKLQATLRADLDACYGQISQYLSAIALDLNALVSGSLAILGDVRVLAGIATMLGGAGCGCGGFADTLFVSLQLSTNVVPVVCSLTGFVVGQLDATLKTLLAPFALSTGIKLGANLKISAALKSTLTAITGTWN